MSMLKTIQNGYAPMRAADVTTDDTELDGATAGYTYDKHDRPSDIFEVGEDCNAVEIYFTGSDSTANTDVFSAKLYGYARENGPAEFIADISGTAGTARINDSATDLFVDSITIDSQGHLKTVSVADSANNRVCKLGFDVIGLRYLYAEFYDVSNGHNAYARTF